MFQGLLGYYPHMAKEVSCIPVTSLFLSRSGTQTTVLDILKEKHPQARPAVPEAITDPPNDDSVQPHPIIFEQITAIVPSKQLLSDLKVQPDLRVWMPIMHGDVFAYPFKTPSALDARLHRCAPQLPDPPPSLPSDCTW